MSTRYSVTPLVQKLGIRTGARIRFVNAPPGYDAHLFPLPPDVVECPEGAGECDFIQFFAKRTAELRALLPYLKRDLASNGMLWIGWPKRSSPLAGDLTRDIVRAEGLHVGLVDVKVCSVDADWSALKFVYRLRDRQRTAKTPRAAGTGSHPATSLSPPDK